MLPSFEEGDSLVTYEAATHGLPIITKRVGAGRLGERQGCAFLIEDNNVRNALEVTKRAHKDRLSLTFIAPNASEAVREFSWGKASQRQAEALQISMATHKGSDWRGL